MNEQELRKMMANILMPQAQKADGTGTAVDWYQAGGLFGTVQGESILVNALVGPKGIEEQLMWTPTKVEKKFTDAITGTDTTTGNQSTVCGDCRTIALNACTQFYPLGRFCAQTPEEQFDNLGLMEVETVPVRALFGNITGPSGDVIIPNGVPITDRFYIDVRMVGYLLRKILGGLIWNGDPANSTLAYKEFKGLEMIVNTGKFDALTDLACPALDSFLMNAASNAWTADGTYAIRAWFARMVHQFAYRAEAAGLDWDTAQMFIVMTQNMWETVSRIYACAGLDLCADSASDANVSVNVSADQSVQRYHALLNSKMLPILGREYPVVIDNMMDETDNGDGTYTSDIYFLTTRINGEDVMYGEYQDFSSTFAGAAAELTRIFGSGNSDIAWTDGGRYALLKSQVRGCFDIQAILKPRIVARAPFLAGRIQNALASPLSTGFPDSDTYDNGADGRTTSPLEYLYSEGIPGYQGFWNPNA